MTKLDDRYTTLTAQLQSQYRNSNVADLIEGILAIKKRFILEAHNTLLSDCIDLSTAKGDALDLWGYLLGVSRWYPLETTPEMRYNLWNFNNKKFYELNFWCPLNGHFEYLNDDEYRDILLYLLRKQNIYPNLKISNELVKEHFDKYSADLKIVDSREMEMIVEYDHSIMPHKLCYFLMLKDILHRPAGVGIKVEDKPAPPPPPPPEPEGRGKSFVILNQTEPEGTKYGLRVVFDNDYLSKIIEQYNATIDPDENEPTLFEGINGFTGLPYSITLNRKKMVLGAEYRNIGLYFYEWTQEGYELFGVPDTTWGDLSEIGEAENHEYVTTGWLDTGKGGLQDEIEPVGDVFGLDTRMLDIYLQSGILTITYARYSRYPSTPLNARAITQLPVYGATYQNLTARGQEYKSSQTKTQWEDYTETCGGYIVLEPAIMLDESFGCADEVVWMMKKTSLNMEINASMCKPEFNSFWDFEVNKYRYDNCLYLPNAIDNIYKVLEYTQTDKRFKRS